MKYQDFFKKLNSGKIAPVYFFYGEESYLIDEGVAKLESEIVTKDSASFNRDVFYGEESDASRIVSTALSIPMLAPKRLVIVKNFQKLAQSGKELILKYSQSPSPQTVLVLISNQVDFRKKVYTGFQKSAELVECKALYGDQILEYIQQFVRKRGKKIKREAVELLRTKMGDSLQPLINETEKLLQVTQKKGEITIEDVEKLVGVSRDFNMFQLWDSLGEKNLKKSLFILKQMLETGESAVYLVSSLTNYFLRLWRIRALKRQNVTVAEIGKILHIHPRFVQSSIQQAKNYSDSEIKLALKRLLEADTQLKTSYLKPNLNLELLIFQILKKKEAA